MRRLVAIAAAVALAAPIAGAWAGVANARGATTSQPTAFLTWPGKTGAASASPTPDHTPAGPVSLPRQFFGAGDDMAAPPPPLMPRSVPGSQAVTSTATANTASNRARQNELMTADSASDGPVGGAESPN